MEVLVVDLGGLERDTRAASAALTSLCRSSANRTVSRTLMQRMPYLPRDASVTATVASSTLCIRRCSKRDTWPGTLAKVRKLEQVKICRTTAHLSDSMTVRWYFEAEY